MMGECQILTQKGNTGKGTGLGKEVRVGVGRYQVAIQVIQGELSSRSWDTSLGLGLGLER